MDKRQPKFQPPGLRLEIQRAGGEFLAVVKTAGKEEVSSHVFEHNPDSLVLNEALWTLDPNALVNWTNSTRRLNQLRSSLAMPKDS